MNCPICLERVQKDLENIVSYKTQHSLFASCSIQICTACKSGWVPNPPKSKNLEVYYRGGAYGGRTFLRFLVKPNLILERGQALARWHFVMKHLKGSPHFSVCDIGAGYGCTYEVAKHKGLNIDFFAFESSSPLCRRIQKLGGKVLGDFFGFQGNNQFELLWASHILEHYACPDDFFKKVKKLLKPSGVCFVEVPCLDLEFKNDVAPHLLFFSLEGLKKVLMRNGFVILSADTVGPLRNEIGSFLSDHRLNGPLKGRLKAIFRSEKSVDEDLQNQSFFDRWQLNRYGGERIWLRAVFARGGDRI